MTDATRSDPVVSVIVPVYNAERFIDGTIQSILQQDYQDFELILVDDCSKDASAERIKPYLSEQVRYLREPVNRGGPSTPRNTGIQAARGRYLMIFDADDIMLPAKLRRTVALLDSQPDAGLLCTGFQSIDDDGKLLSVDYLKEYRQFRAHLMPLAERCFRLSGDHAYRELLHANFVGTSSVAIPRRVLDEVGGFDDSITNGDDYDMWLRIVQRYDLLFIDDVLHQYRINSSSISFRGGAKNAINRITVLERQFDNGLDQECAREVNYWLANNHYQIAEAGKAQGDNASARRHFLKSLRCRFSRMALKGLIVSLLPAWLVRASKKN